MAKKLLAAQRRAIAKLLKILRPILMIEVPVYMTIVKGHDEHDAGLIVDVLAKGFIGDSDGYLTWGGPGLGTLILRAYAPQLQDGLKQLEAIAQPIADGTRLLFEQDGLLTPDLSTPDKRIVYAALLTRLLSDAVRGAEPESPLLPDSRYGLAVYETYPNHPGAPPAICLPTGRVDGDYRDFDKWQKACAIVKEKEVSIYAMQTPLVTAITRTTRFISEHLDERLAKQIDAEKVKQEQRSKAPRPPRLILGGETDHPIIDGKQMPQLTAREFRIINALVLARSAGQSRLQSPELDRDSKTDDARKVLKKLAEAYPAWKQIIQFPERKGMGYGIK